MKAKYGLILVLAAAILWGVGVLCKIQHWPMAGLFLMLSMLLWPIGVILLLVELLKYPGAKDFLDR